MIIVDALIFIAQNIAGLAYAIGYLFMALGKIILIIFKPVWFIFFYLFGFIQTLFNTPITQTSVWTPDNNVMTFITSFPLMGTFLSAVVLMLIISVTVGIIKPHAK